MRGERNVLDAKKEGRFLVIGIGNEYRHDDAVGLVVARTLKIQDLPDTVIAEVNAPGATLLDLWQNDDRVIIVDAVYGVGHEPGAIHRIDTHIKPFPVGDFGPSSHGFGLAETVALARALHRLPHRLIVYGIEACDFSMGMGLSQAVQNAVPIAVSRIVGEIGATWAYL